MTDSKRLTPATILIFVAVFALLGLLGWGLRNQKLPQVAAGEVVPEFDVYFYDDYAWQNKKMATLDDFEGRPIVLNFWASWCVPCRLEAEILENAWQAHGNEVVFVGVAYADVDSKALAFLEEFNITYPNAPDLGSAVSDRFRITGVPETFFIDSDGKLVAHVPLPVTAVSLEQLIAEIK